MPSVVGFVAFGFCAGNAIGSARARSHAAEATPPEARLRPLPPREDSAEQASAAPAAAAAAAPPPSPWGPGNNLSPGKLDLSHAVLLDDGWVQFIRDIMVTPAGCRALERYVKSKLDKETVSLSKNLTLELNLRDIKMA